MTILNYLIMNNKPLKICVFLLLITNSVLSQDNKLDSLQNAYKRSRQDTNKILVLQEIYQYYSSQANDSALIINNQIIEESKKIKYYKGIVQAYIDNSGFYLKKGQLTKALKQAYKARKMAKKYKLISFQITSNLFISSTYERQKEYTKSIEYAKEALKIAQKTKDTSGILLSSNTIGYTYSLTKESNLALKYLFKSLELSENREKTVHSYTLNNIADVYAKQGKYDKALSFYQKSLEEKKALNNTWAMSYTLNGMAKVYRKKGNYDKSIELLLEGLKTTQEAGFLVETLMLSKTLYETYELNQDYEKAFKYLKLHKKSNDSIFTKDKLKIINDIETKAALEKKDLLIKQEKTSLQFQQLLTWTILIILLLLLIMLYFIWNNLKNQRNTKNIVIEKNQKLEDNNNELNVLNEELRQVQEELYMQHESLDEQNKILNLQNQKINSSIKVAESIQRAFFTYEKRLKNLTEDYFLINRPKDVVSGDFYWVSKINDTIILIVADCTGHGVPGAFMTLIADNLLDKTIEIGQELNPANILNQLHQEIQTTLQQKKTNDNNGMDMVVLALKKQADSVNLTFAGAKNNVLIYSNQEQIELKGTRKSIGGIQNEQIEFENQSISLQKGSLIYAGSDGLEDQNNKKRKKFGRRKLKKLLSENIDLPLDRQKEKIEQVLENHMQGTHQRDDILWLGVKI